MGLFDSLCLPWFAVHRREKKKKKKKKKKVVLNLLLVYFCWVWKSHSALLICNLAALNSFGVFFFFFLIFNCV